MYVVCPSVWAGLPTCVHNAADHPTALRQGWGPCQCVSAHLCWCSVTDREALRNWVQLQSPSQRQNSSGEELYIYWTDPWTYLSRLLHNYRETAGGKKRQDKWEECERGREECLSLEKPILSVPVPGCIKLLIVSLKLSSKDALGKNCCIKLPWRFFLGCSKYLPLATSVSPYALLQGP